MHRPFRLALLSAASTVGALWPADIAAQTLPRLSTDVVVTAAATPVPADATGRSVSILSREDLARLGVSSIIEGLRLLPGVDPRARGPHDVQTDFSLRGATFGQALVLLDGVRLNHAQTGHHNGEIPAPLAGIDRIEVVAGPASAVHGADAFGGTIQVITRAGRHASGEMALGPDRTASLQASTSGYGLPATWTASAWGARSDGFMYDRDFALGGGSLRGRPHPALTLDVRHQRRAFGANGFYGDSPSKEWTSGTNLSGAWSRTGQAWSSQIRAAERTHRDRFRWDIRRPGFAENTHRTTAATLDATVSHLAASTFRLTTGTGGGIDRIASSNLGDRDFTRAYLFSEALWTPRPRLSIQAGARVDHYSTFGAAWSPSVSISGRLADRLRLRGSVARAFRTPTFTERYYSDPAHLATADLRPERGWAVESGADLTAGAWTLSVTPFLRRDDDVIDWVRNTPAERWRTTNIHAVTTRGVEVSVARQWARALLRAHYTALDVETTRVAMLSKYVLDYTRQSAGVALALPVTRQAHLAFTADARDRVDGQRYLLVGGRVTHPVGRVDLYAAGTNLLNARYREVAGVPMPGRAWSVGLRLR